MKFPWVSKLAKTKRVDGIIALGAVIEVTFTYHHECTRGLSEIQSAGGYSCRFWCFDGGYTFQAPIEWAIRHKQRRRGDISGH